MHRRGFAAILLVLAGIFTLCQRADAEDVIAVLSSESAPYQEALDGLKEVYNQPIQTVILSREAFKQPRPDSIVVAFGGKAALQVAASYQGTIIYSLAPGIQIRARQRSESLVKIDTSPSIRTVIRKYKDLQPALHRIGVLWIGDSIGDYFIQTKEIESAIGVEMMSVRLKTLEELPSQLRSLQGKVEAIWMPPDAALVTPESFAAVREFCIAQHMALYVPSDGLVEKGATAAIYSSFHDLGRLTGSILAKAVNGSLGSTVSVFPERTAVAINVSAAAKIGLKISAEELKKADRVIE